MNGIGIRVTPEQLRQVAVQLNGAAGDIDGTLRQLAASVEPLGTDWAGVAQAHFLELWATPRSGRVFGPICNPGATQPLIRHHAPSRGRSPSGPRP